MDDNLFIDGQKATWYELRDDWFNRARHYARRATGSTQSRAYWQHVILFLYGA